ncbi:hypothetical protein N7527_005144 [Penicillium freii]|nr:hypothetical protein N7527_005144 [Penicillium freii]
MQYRLLVAALAAAITLVLAQQAPDCNAFEKTCPSNKGNTRGHIKYDLTQTSALNDWTTLGGAVVTGPDGAEFTIHKQEDAPTIVTDYYIFYGEVSVEMKASPGTGIVSAVYMLSDANDEIDWEALGGSTDKLQTNYYGKGDNSEDYDRWTWQPVTTPQEVFHRYTWIWSKEKLSWAIDGTVVRTVDYADAKDGTRFPQTPMRVRIGIWAGGDPSRIKGTIDWAGGETDYSKAPFTMYVKSIEIVNYTPAESYVYSDKSGSSDSIQINGGVSSGESSGSSSTGLSTTTSPPVSQTGISASSTVTSSLAKSETSMTTDISISALPSSSEFSGATTNCSSPSRTPPTTSSAEPKSTVLRSNSISAASSTTTASSISNSGTAAVASATSSFNSACALSPSYLALLTPIVGFIQMWTWVLRV